MRIIRRLSPLAASAIALALAFGGSACSTGPGDGVLTLEVAKFRTKAFERDIAAFVPERNQGALRQNEQSKIIFPCLGEENMSYWPGALKIDLQGEFDSEAILAGMERKWGAKPGWTVIRGENNEGVPFLEMATDEGYRFTVAFFGGPQFSINSYSACFTNQGLEGNTSY